ncbi:hypothetical protein BM1_09201 [Bipolaris maydis]|nr:hypothetical protein BM1_09201 [Bipolaris maydis]
MSISFDSSIEPFEWVLAPCKVHAGVHQFDEKDTTQKPLLARTVNLGGQIVVQFFKYPMQILQYEGQLLPLPSS